MSEPEAMAAPDSAAAGGGASEAPAGYRALDAHGGFLGTNGPIYWRKDDADGGLRFGTRIERRHCNPMGKCHGGWIATLFDIILPCTARVVLPQCHDRYFLTVNLAIDYLGPVRLGDWLEGKPRVLKSTRRMVFADGLLCVNGEAVARGNAVLRIGPEISSVDGVPALTVA